MTPEEEEELREAMPFIDAFMRIGFSEWWKTLALLEGEDEDEQRLHDRIKDLCWTAFLAGAETANRLTLWSKNEIS